MFHEALNLAQLWKVPAIYCVENNKWAESTPYRQHCPIDDLGDRAVAFGMHMIQAYGQDVEAVSRSRERGGRVRPLRQRPGLPPRRHLPPGAAQRRRPAEVPPKEEYKQTKATEDPIEKLRERLGLSDEEFGEHDQRAKDIALDAVEFARAGTDPTPEQTLGRRLCLARAYSEAVRDVMSQAMRQDPEVFLMGQDIGEHGGSQKVSVGMLEEFGPERVRNTPISEMAMTGLGIGAAMMGMRPIVEIMYEDFLTLSMEQLVNQAAKHRYMSGGQVKVPLTVRTQGGAGWNPAGQHGQQVEGWFVGIPGPEGRLPVDAVGCARADLVVDLRRQHRIVFEHLLLYGMKEDVPDTIEPIPFGKARTFREGTDVTVVATGPLVHEALKAAEEAEKDGISVEVIDPRTLQPLDEEAIVSSVKKTNRLVVAHEAVTRMGFGAEVAAVVQEQAFD